MEFYIEELENFTLDLPLALNKLLKQINEDARALKEADIKNMINSSSNHLFVARRSDNKEIVGMLSLIVYRIPVWKKGWIEDIVVDREYRNKGIATQLIRHAIEKAKAKRVLSLNLTSSPQRQAANRLYKRLGFEKRNTNVYQIKV